MVEMDGEAMKGKEWKPLYIKLMLENLIKLSKAENRIFILQLLYNHGIAW